jgi:hypothetical protein
VIEGEGFNNQQIENKGKRNIGMEGWHKNIKQKTGERIEKPLL